MNRAPEPGPGQPGLQSEAAPQAHRWGPQWDADGASHLAVGTEWTQTQVGRGVGVGGQLAPPHDRRPRRCWRASRSWTTACSWVCTTSTSRSVSGRPRAPRAPLTRSGRWARRRSTPRPWSPSRAGPRAGRPSRRTTRRWRGSGASRSCLCPGPLARREAGGGSREEGERDTTESRVWPVPGLSTGQQRPPIPQPPAPRGVDGGHTAAARCSDQGVQISQSVDGGHWPSLWEAQIPFPPAGPQGGLKRHRRQQSWKGVERQPQRRWKQLWMSDPFIARYQTRGASGAGLRTVLPWRCQAAVRGDWVQRGVRPPTPPTRPTWSCPGPALGAWARSQTYGVALPPTL